MSGFFLGSPLGAPSSLATAAVPFPDDRGAPSHRSRPTFALALSAGIHAAALAAFLWATAHSGLEPVRTMAIRMIVDPRIDVARFVPPPSLERPASGSRSTQGDIRVVDRELTIPEILKDLGGPPVDGPVKGPTGPRTGADGPADVPAYIPPAGDPSAPSPFDEAPVPIMAPEPIYPDIAREAGIEGRVVVHALVTRDGTVAKVDVTGANAILAEAASKAVYAWKFKPAKRKGQTVAAWIVVPVNFRLQ